LLDCGYTLLDTVLQTMGLPPYRFRRDPAGRREERPLPLRYRGHRGRDLPVSRRRDRLVVVSRVAVPEDWRVDLHASEGSVHIALDRVAVRKAGAAESCASSPDRRRRWCHR